MNRKDEEKYKKKLVKNLFKKKSEIKKINKRKMENFDVLFCLICCRDWEN